MVLNKDYIRLFTEVDEPAEKLPSKANYETVPTEQDLALVTFNTSVTGSADRDGPDHPVRNLRKFKPN